MPNDSALLADFAAFFTALPQTVAAIRAEVRERVTEIVRDRLGRSLDELASRVSKCRFSPDRERGADLELSRLSNDLTELQHALAAVPGNAAEAARLIEHVAEFVKVRSGR